MKRMFSILVSLRNTRKNEKKSQQLKPKQKGKEEKELRAK